MRAAAETPAEIDARETGRDWLNPAMAVGEHKGEISASDTVTRVQKR